MNIISEDQQNTEYIHLKHFLDNDEELAKQSELLEGNDDEGEEENCSSEEANISKLSISFWT